MSSLKLYDCLILGGGPAGLSVAQGLARVHRTCAVFSDSRYRNEGIHASHNIITRDGVHPDDFRRIAREQIEPYHNTDFFDTRITRVAKTSFDGRMEFEASDENGQRWQGRRLVMATGCKDVFPSIEGYKENWPQKIYQCLFCDGHERSHLPKGILTFPSPMYLKFASMAKYQSTNSSTVTIFTDGPPSKDAAICQALEDATALDLKVEERKIKRLEPAGELGVDVVLEDEEKVYMGFLVHKPVTTPVADDIVESLGIEIEQSLMGKNIKSSRPWCSTNVKGVFVAGDAGTPITNVLNAMASGAMVAGGIAHELCGEDDETALEKYRKNVRIGLKQQ